MNSLPSLQTNTIVRLPADLLTEPSASRFSGDSTLPCQLETRQELKIRLLSDHLRLDPVNMLIRERYAWRGYSADGIQQTQHLITLQATLAENTVGTISIRFDNQNGLQLDQLFKTEIDELRHQGAQLCEFTKLAISGDLQSRQLTAALFHIAFICAYRIHQCSDICIEVNPRHVNFYKRMLGFQQLSEARENPKIQAPSVLMSLDLREAAELIQQFAGKHELGIKIRSFYPYFFPLAQEQELTQRLCSLQHTQGLAA